MTVWYVLLMVINPLFEELIVRSFFIEKIEALTNSSLVAIILSIILQLLPHIYQGFIALIYLGVMFTIFSLYYIRYRRIVPVILAHIFLILLR
ncbi:CPBP family intramembrane glutamic endopeptidase [Vallitalea guaymasensis]